MILEKIWARALGHYIGKTDDDMPEIPIITLREAKIVLILKTMWVMLQITTCLFIIANVIKHWR
jgi:hypothetical protein|tara:strand:- start:865 stop:1056 length:192 start_codon:yes stop_codon:yes gene_type:complete